MKKDSLCLGRSRLRWRMLPCAEGPEVASVSCGVFPLSLCVFLLCLAAVVQHRGCCFICYVVSRLWWFLSVVTFHYGTKHLKTWGLKAADVLLLPALLVDGSSADLTWVYLHGFSQLGDSFAMAETTGVLWSLFPA